MLNAKPSHKKFQRDNFSMGYLIEIISNSWISFKINRFEIKSINNDTYRIQAFTS